MVLSLYDKCLFDAWREPLPRFVKSNVLLAAK